MYLEETCHWVPLIQILSFGTLRNSLDCHISNEIGPPVVSHVFLLWVQKKKKTGNLARLQLRPDIFSTSSQITSCL